MEIYRLATGYGINSCW